MKFSFENLPCLCVYFRNNSISCLMNNNMIMVLVVSVNTHSVVTGLLTALSINNIIFVFMVFS